MKSDSLRIVVADDDERMVEFYCDVLTRGGYQVVGTAINGRELLRICLDLVPDLLITDVRMPEMDGIEAAREANRSITLPTIFVSAFFDAKLLAAANKDFMRFCVLKPIKRDELLEILAFIENT